MNRHWVFYLRLACRRGWRAVAAQAGCVLALFAVGGGLVFAAQEPPKLSVFIVPQLTVIDTHRAWAPFLKRLGARTGMQFELRHSTSIPQFEAYLESGEPDLAFINPYHAVMMKHRPGYIALARSTIPLTGVVVVAADSPIKSLQQLNGMDIAFPAPNAFGASLFIRALLAYEGIRFTPRYVKTHQNVYRHIIMGDVAAGGGIRTTLERESDAVQEKLRVMFETVGVAPHPLVAHPRVAPQLRERIVSEIMAMGADADRPLLAAVGLTVPMRADYARDYQSLEKYNFQRFVIHGEITH